MSRDVMGGISAVNQPYPSQWKRRLVLSDGRQIFARPIRPDDEPLLLQLLQHVSPEDLRLRFFDSIEEFTHPFLARLTRLDYARAMAFIALDEASGEAFGVVRLHSDSTGDGGEYANASIGSQGPWIGLELDANNDRIRENHGPEADRRAGS